MAKHWCQFAALAFFLVAISSLASAHTHTVSVSPSSVAPSTALANSSTYFIFTIKNAYAGQYMNRIEINRNTSGFSINNSASCPYGWHINVSDSTRVICESNSTAYNSDKSVNISLLAVAPTSIGNKTWRSMVIWADTWTETKSVIIQVVPPPPNPPPQVTIYSPQNRTYSTSSIGLNYTAIDSDLSSCWYTLDSGSSVILPACANSTLSDLAIGQHTLSVYANDSNGEVGSSAVSFTVIPPPTTASDYVVTWARSSRLFFRLGENFTIEVRVKNIGSQNATIASVTWLGANCTQMERAVPALRAGEEYSDPGFSCTCNAPGWNAFVAIANVFRSVYEANYSNNNASGVFWCGASRIPACQDYV